MSTILIWLLAVIAAILISMFIANCKILFGVISNTGKQCRKFIINNTGFFTLLFLFIFFFEQLVLVIIVYKYFNASPDLQVLISIFALVVVTTATLQKFIWEYKFQYMKQKANDFENDNNLLLSRVKILLRERKHKTH